MCDVICGGMVLCVVLFGDVVCDVMCVVWCHGVVMLCVVLSVAVWAFW